MNNLLQAGGHQLIKIKDNKIIKPTRLGEVEFYKEYLPKYPELCEFVPKYYGFDLIGDIRDLFTDKEYQIITEKKYDYYIELENLLDMSRDIKLILDVKLGSIHWRKNELEKTIENCKLRNKNSTTTKYGFRLDGVIYDNQRYTKEEYRNMTIMQIVNMLYKF
ncbi:MAG: inositol polyphosphate kinase family protein, partial [Nitrososphaeraceae archaeon]|nr:inositol polyphosphate kinase family protein [Nitrososphaeraceae archaeon]